jgi:DNA uptake protein ComE-like DNA-binding protein
MRGWMTAVDLNEATEAQLERLPGIGRTSANKIIASRPFTSVTELLKIGISNQTIRRIIGLVTVKSTDPIAPTPEKLAVP